MGEAREMEEWRMKRRRGKGGDEEMVREVKGRLKSDTGRHARGPYSFTHELSGGKRVRRDKIWSGVK